MHHAACRATPVVLHGLLCMVAIKPVLVLGLVPVQGPGLFLQPCVTLPQGQHAPRKAVSNLGGSAAANGQQRLAPELVAALVGAGRFVFDRIKRLKQDMAAARLEMLRGGSLFAAILCHWLHSCRHMCLPL